MAAGSHRRHGRGQLHRRRPVAVTGGLEPAAADRPQRQESLPGAGGERPARLGVLPGRHGATAPPRSVLLHPRLDVRRGGVALDGAPNAHGGSHHAHPRAMVRAVGGAVGGAVPQQLRVRHRRSGTHVAAAVRRTQRDRHDRSTGHDRSGGRRVRRPDRLRPGIHRRLASAVARRDDLARGALVGGRAAHGRREIDALRELEDAADEIEAVVADPTTDPSAD